MRRLFTACALCMPLWMLEGCASAPASSAGSQSTAVSSSRGQGALGLMGDIADKALAAVGLKKPTPPDLPDTPDVPDSALPDWRVNWRVHASESLNVDSNGKPLALLVRIYRLRSPEAFLQAPYESFGELAKEKSTLSEDLLSVRELQLLPGQQHQALDKVSREARYLGIVALYRTPSVTRWRYAFSTSSAARSGLHLGVHACAMSVQVGEPIGLEHRNARATAPCEPATP